MKTFRTKITNRFSVPKRIKRLVELAYNLWWTWNPKAERLFSRIDKELWEETYHNPVRFLRQVKRARLNAVINDRYYLQSYDRVFDLFDKYMKEEKTWFSYKYPNLKNRPIAYFSMEFGLHETLPIYAGGLGILSGDHVKEASDLGLPFVAIGFFYTEGYFTQRITEDGWQEARYLRHPLDELPVLPIVDENNKPVTISVELPDREILACLWEIHVGRIPVYLLDTNLEENEETDRLLTARLYSGDLDLRISQEMVLGIGGLRALRVLGYNPSVFHMNEGHSAFLTQELARELVTGGHSYQEAKKKVENTTVFTTHTPVPAGNDEFPLWIIDKYLSKFWDELGLDRDEFINLARHEVPWGETYSMPVLALKLSKYRNAVSELHGEVARKMWHFLWPKREVEDVPITHITNGVHTTTWMARRLRGLFDDHLGTEWLEHIDDPEVWEGVLNIPDDEFWSVRRHLKRKLVAYMRERARNQWLQGDMHPVQALASGLLLDPYALTIGFARRFAPYKRANLVLSDLERLIEIINRPGKPVQIIFAGKSHPDHEGGKKIIQEVYRAVKKYECGGRLVFLDDYDMNLARYLVQGVDVWLNTPRRPNEASGTSGQKAALNGVLNFSVLDGWWREGYNGVNGWAIGDDIDYEDPDLQDKNDAESLYDILENEIVPLYYSKRSSDRLPGDWIARSKESIRTISPHFSIRRMVKEYTERLYLPLMQNNN